MNAAKQNKPNFWQTVRLLLGASRRRAKGRQKRQGQLLNNRSRGAAIDWGVFGFILTILLMAVMNGAAAVAVYRAATAGERIEVERSGKIVVDQWFLKLVKRPGNAADDSLDTEARLLNTDSGHGEETMREKLRQSLHSHGTRDLIADGATDAGLAAAVRRPLPAMLGSAMLIWWGVMLVFQGEGLELDLQRRRHPMWEWLFSHPAPPGAIFLAEMLSPISANPIYCTAPLFAGILYGLAYGTGVGIVAGILIGVPVCVAAACLGKALEIGVTLRFSPRSRGAMIGLMTWMGYTSMMLIMVIAIEMPIIVNAIQNIAVPLARLPWPWLGLFLGQTGGAHPIIAGILACWIASGIAIFGAISVAVWGAQNGLAGNYGEGTLPAPKNRHMRFGKDPLYSKELLWFRRDRSAIVQTILIPLTLAGYQAFNLHNAFRMTGGGWNSLCGVAIIFGTYFLWVLGPKSLLSEGPALWMTLTWPRGLEELLKAKAWLWALVSSGIVLLILCMAAFLFPADAWKIVLVGAGWFLFARSMSEKTVTLVTVTSSSGEPEKIPAGRRWAAALGIITFAIGVCTQQWHIAIMGIVYSYLTAAAMWQNFRARLPYLYDPWSEELPPPPTLMHAMIAISVMVEGGAIFAVLAILCMGSANAGAGIILAYSLSTIGVAAFMSAWLRYHEVASSDIWLWRSKGDDSPRGLLTFSSLVTGIAGGLALGLFALGYLKALHLLPSIGRMIDQMHRQMADYPSLHVMFGVYAILVAPFAEEYLFRGLLFRALDREWGGWRAVIGSGAFFAIYHPVISWVPVCLLGVINSLLFKKFGRLAPAVALHMVYNAVVLAFS